MQDGYSYKISTASCSTSGDRVWNRNAYAFEGISFDSCNGHPDVSSKCIIFSSFVSLLFSFEIFTGAYHNHIDPSCLYTKSSSSHSPILGWMLDGYPIYG